MENGKTRLSSEPMNNTYGITRPSVINLQNDVEIWYKYRPSRTSTDEAFESFKSLDPSEVLSQSTAVSDEANNRAASPLQGMFDLRLPADRFGVAGIYTIYIKPREISCKIADIGVLAAYPDIVGVVIDNSDNKLPGVADALVGYRVEYFNSEGDREDYYRIVTGSNPCSVITQQLTSASSSTSAYRLAAASDLLFLTVSPSTSPSYKPSSRPFIGATGGSIAIVNTKFDPVCLEVEMTNVDLEMVNTAIVGSQIRNLDTSRLSTFNEDGSLLTQAEFYDVKDDYTSQPLYQIRKRITDSPEVPSNASELLNL